MSVPPVVASTPSGVMAAPRPTMPEAPTILPATGAIDAITPQQAAQLAQLAASLNGKDYFQVLQLDVAATPVEIKKAFYRDSRLFHPDRFFHITDEVSKNNIGQIYRRVTEAYFVLRDDAKRRKYVTDISGAERAQKLRFTDVSEAEQRAEAKKQVEEEFGTNPKSRQFFKSALADIEKENWAAAERNLKMAVTYESSNAKFKEKLAEVQRKLEEQRKGGDSFKIK